MNSDEFGEQMHIRGQLEALLKVQLKIQEEINELEEKLAKPASNKERR